MGQCSGRLIVNWIVSESATRSDLPSHSSSCRGTSFFQDHILQAPPKRSGSNSPRSNGFTIVLFGPLLALVHATRAEALFLLEPYGRGLDLSLAADHHLHRASDAEEAVLSFCRHWSSRANGTRPDFGAGALDAGRVSQNAFTILKNSGRRVRRRARLALRIDSGRSRKSSPSMASMSKAQSWTSSLCLFECSALKIGDAINAKDDCLAIDDEMLPPVP